MTEKPYVDEFLPRLSDERFEQIRSKLKQMNEGDIVDFQTGIVPHKVTKVLSEGLVHLEIADDCAETVTGLGGDGQEPIPQTELDFLRTDPRTQTAAVGARMYNRLYNFLMGTILTIEPVNGGQAQQVYQVDWRFIPECFTTELQHPDLSMSWLNNPNDTIQELRGKNGLDIEDHVVTAETPYLGEDIESPGAPVRVIPVVGTDGHIKLFDADNQAYAGAIDIMQTAGYLYDFAKEFVDPETRRLMMRQPDFPVLFTFNSARELGYSLESEEE